MLCPNCGSKNPESATFCSACGANMKSASSQSFSGNNSFSDTSGFGFNNQSFDFNQPVKSQNGKGMAVAALVMGILGLTICPGITSILAVIFGIVAKTKGNRSGMATTGIVLGIIAIVMAIIGIIIMCIGGAYVYNFIQSVAPEFAYLFDFLQDPSSVISDPYAYQYYY